LNVKKSPTTRKTMKNSRSYKKKLWKWAWEVLKMKLSNCPTQTPMMT
jgi:hypothetical protein